MIGRDLFHRFFVRFLIAHVIAAAIMIFLVHLFQKRVIHHEWREDLRQEAHWSALHFGVDMADQLARAWATTHGTVRLTIFDDGGEVIADSHPERPVPDLERVRAGGSTRGSVAACDRLRDDAGWVVVSRPWVPPFPHGLQWELVLAAIAMFAVVAASLYPLVRSMSITLRQLAGLSDEVSAGHFGKTLPVPREDELGALVRAFNQMSAKLAEAEQLNQRLLHDLSHELRSPLGRIQVLAERLVMRPDEARERLRDIEEEVALLDRLVGDLLQSARMEARQDPLVTQSFSLAAWASETFRRHEKRVRAHSIEWSQRLPDDDAVVSGDPQRLAQAIGNVVDNAIHALEGRDDASIAATVAAGPEGVVDHPRGRRTGHPPRRPAARVPPVLSGRRGSRSRPRRRRPRVEPGAGDRRGPRRRRADRAGRRGRRDSRHAAVPASRRVTRWRQHEASVRGGRTGVSALREPIDVARPAIQHRKRSGQSHHLTRHIPPTFRSVACGRSAGGGG